jgi:hypothetical protein
MNASGSPIRPSEPPSRTCLPRGPQSESADAHQGDAIDELVAAGVMTSFGMPAAKCSTADPEGKKRKLFGRTREDFLGTLV